MIATLATTDGPRLVDARGDDSDFDFNSSETPGSVIQSRGSAREATSGSVITREKTSHVFFSPRELCWQRSSGAIGVVTLTKVKHRRELLFAALPTLFAIHQFIEGFVWLGLDGILSPAVAHDMGAAFMLYAQGLLPFLLPLSVLLFEPNAKSRRQNAAVSCVRRSNGALYLVGADGVPIAGVCQGKQYRVHQSSDKQYSGCVALCDCNLWFAVFLEDQNDGNLRRGKPGDTAGCMEVKRYAFTSLWCAYAAVASVIILAYFWRSHEERPFQYA